MAVCNLHRANSEGVRKGEPGVIVAFEQTPSLSWIRTLGKTWSAPVSRCGQKRRWLIEVNRDEQTRER